MRFLKSIVCGLLTIAMIYFVVNIVQMQGNISKESRKLSSRLIEIEQLRSQENQLEEQVEILEELKQSNDMKLLEQYARKQGLIKQGEYIYKNDKMVDKVEEN